MPDRLTRAGSIQRSLLDTEQRREETWARTDRLRRRRQARERQARQGQAQRVLDASAAYIHAAYYWAIQALQFLYWLITRTLRVLSDIVFSQILVLVAIILGSIYVGLQILGRLFWWISLVRGLYDTAIHASCTQPHLRYLRKAMNRDETCVRLWDVPLTAADSKTPIQHIIEEEPWNFFNTSITFDVLTATLMSLDRLYLRDVAIFVHFRKDHMIKGPELYSALQEASALFDNNKKAALQFSHKQQAHMSTTEIVLRSLAEDLEDNESTFKARSQFSQMALDLICDLVPTLDSWTPRARMLADLDRFVVDTLWRLKQLQRDGETVEGNLARIDEHVQRSYMIITENVANVSAICPSIEGASPPSGGLSGWWTRMRESRTHRAIATCAEVMYIYKDQLGELQQRILEAQQLTAEATDYVTRLHQQVERADTTLKTMKEGRPGPSRAAFKQTTGQIQTFIKFARQQANILEEIHRQLEKIQKERVKAVFEPLSPPPR